MVVIALPSLCGLGCGDDDGGSADASSSIDAATADATAADAGAHDAGVLVTENCPASYGPSSVAMTFAVAGAGIGFDLDGAADPDGDGMVDNIIGANDGVRTILSSSLAGNIADGSLRTLTELRDLTSLTADDSTVNMVVYGGVDSDDPAFLTDDFSGDEDYYFSHDWVEPEDCAPRGAMAATYSGGVLTASAPEIVFFVNALGGFLEIAEARLEATLEVDTKGAKSPAGTPVLFGGAIKQCALAEGPGQIGLSAQHDLAQSFSIQPDVDLDNDGLETIQSDSAGIISCTDGDGTTVIMGELCGCDPRMADGYSIAFTLDIVGAGLLGPEPLN